MTQITVAKKRNLSTSVAMLTTSMKKKKKDGMNLCWKKRVHFFNRCRGKFSHPSTLSVFLTSDGEHVLLLDGGVQLQRELWRGAQERLDDGGAFEGVPVHGQDALRLANLPLHGRALAPLQADLPGDGHIGLLLLTRLEVDHEGLCAPAGTQPREGVAVSGVTLFYQQRAVQGYICRTTQLRVFMLDHHRYCHLNGIKCNCRPHKSNSEIIHQNYFLS